MENVAYVKFPASVAEPHFCSSLLFVSAFGRFLETCCYSDANLYVSVDFTGCRCSF